MGQFHLVYYISMGSPSIEYSLQKAETYLAQGVRALQFDLPSRNPYRETPFIKECMAKAWETYGGYGPFLSALTEFRRKHPDFEMQMVSYEDVILTIGTDRYIDFCKKNGIKICRISGDGVIEQARLDMNAAGEGRGVRRPDWPGCHAAQRARRNGAARRHGALGRADSLSPQSRRDRADLRHGGHHLRHQPHGGQTSRCSRRFCGKLPDESMERRACNAGTVSRP